MPAPASRKSSCGRWCTDDLLHRRYPRRHPKDHSLCGADALAERRHDHHPRRCRLQLLRKRAGSDRQAEIVAPQAHNPLHPRQPRNSPANIPTYKTKEWNGGIVWYEDEYPNLLFAKDGEIYTLNGLNYLAIGGAYSVDKFYRVARGYGWWVDEQPSDEIKRYVEKQLRTHKVDIVLSHTCPGKYIPTEMFLPTIDQSAVDHSTEEWLDKIEDSLDYRAWYCGHWHTDKRVDRMHFLYHGFESEEDRGV